MHEKSKSSLKKTKNIRTRSCPGTAAFSGGIFMINNINIMGRLTADPEIRYTGNDNVCVCNFSLAHTRPLSKNGERITDFFDCVAWRGRAEFLERNFSKGDMIAIAGKLYSESFVDKNDIKGTAIKIVQKNILKTLIMK